jgi:hypothetical protein
LDTKEKVVEEGGKLWTSEGEMGLVGGVEVANMMTEEQKQGD